MLAEEPGVRLALHEPQIVHIGLLCEMEQNHSISSVEKPKFGPIHEYGGLSISVDEAATKFDHPITTCNGEIC